ncbi:hypothetical protein M153_41090001548, partial [Pseudoloma neurophilia]
KSLNSYIFNCLTVLKSLNSYIFNSLSIFKRLNSYNCFTLRSNHLLSTIFTFYFYFISIEQTFYNSHVQNIKQEISEILSQDRTYFENIFRQDLIFVINRNNDQINELFGLKKALWQHIPYLKDINKPKQARLFNKNYFPDDKKELIREHSVIRCFYEQTIIKIIDKYEQVINFMTRILTRNKFDNFYSMLQYIFKDEIFIFKENGKFVTKEFQNHEDLVNFLNKNKKIMFYYTDHYMPSSCWLINKKTVYERTFQNHYHFFKTFKLKKILSEIIKEFEFHQKCTIRRTFFYFYSNRIKKLYQSIGIELEFWFKSSTHVKNYFTIKLKNLLKIKNILKPKNLLNLENIRLMNYNISMRPINYDTHSIFFTMILKNGDPSFNFVYNLFNDLAVNFNRSVRELKQGMIKIHWSTAYINNIFLILENYAILKKHIDLSIYPEIVPMMMPVPIFLDTYEQFYNGPILRTVIDFKNLYQFLYFDEFFNRKKIDKIVQVSDRYMNSLFFHK